MLNSSINCHAPFLRWPLFKLITTEHKHYVALAKLSADYLFLFILPFSLRSLIGHVLQISAQICLISTGISAFFCGKLYTVKLIVIGTKTPKYNLEYTCYNFKGLHFVFRAVLYFTAFRMHYLEKLCGYSSWIYNSGWFTKIDFKKLMCKYNTSIEAA